jgi:IS1 family transposase
VDRATHCIVGYAVVAERTPDVLQGVVDQAPHARAYYSDGFPAYRELVYGPAEYAALLNKSETYSVEGSNADLRHYLARLARKSRCFSRCLGALRRAVRLFVWCYNQRQLWNRRYPKHPRPITDFLSPLC